MSGTTVPVRISGPAVCHTCHGSGAEPGTDPITCPTCGGAGSVSVNQGFFSMEQPCPECRGTGRIIEHPCPTCHGSGAERRTRKFQVKIPAGVKDGARIKLARRGEPGPAGGQPGDLYVRVRVRDARRVRPQGRQPHRRSAGLLSGGGAGRERRGAHAERPGHVEGARRHAERQDVPGARQGRAEEGRPRRHAGHRQRRRAGASCPARRSSCSSSCRRRRRIPLGSDWGWPDGERQDRERRRKRPRGVHDQRGGGARRGASADPADLRAEGTGATQADAGQHAPLLRRGRRAPAMDPGADAGRGHQPGRGEAHHGDARADGRAPATAWRSCRRSSPIAARSR